MVLDNTVCKHFQIYELIILNVFKVDDITIVDYW